MPVAPAATRTLTVAATYMLSEEGRKASLLAGGDGRAVQELRIEVPASRLHLVSVDASGVARLKLRSQYQLDDHRGVLRIDASPIYDAAPSLEELFAKRPETINSKRRSTLSAARPVQNAAMPNLRLESMICGWPGTV